MKNYRDILNKIENSLEGNAHLDDLAKKNNDPFKILISTILSARTRDACTIEATETLFNEYNTPELIANADIEHLEILIKKSGFYKVKAARIKDVSKLLLEKYEGKVPQNFDDLIELPGVGAKTANCVLVYAFKIPAIPVDTHVHRIPNRLGWIQTKAPEQTEKKLKEMLPEDQWIRVNRIFVKFGQQTCLPTNPRCDSCPISETCPKIFTIERKRKKNLKVLKVKLE
ncbi:MAG: endonuclease III domain-containing protein [Promethearchaeota archaeon]